MGLPYAAHSHLMPLLSNTLPIFNEICRRSAKFILSCLCSGSALIRTVVNYGILARSHSFIGHNIMFLCYHFHFSAADFKFGQASHLSNTISSHHRDTVSDEDLYMLILRQNYCACATSLIFSLMVMF